MNRNLATWLVFGALGMVLALAGYTLMFSTLMAYDDEGYVLWSLLRYSEVGGLYSRVFSQYGPFPYVAYDLLHRGGLFPFDHTTGRLFTLAYWVATAAGGGALAWLITRSRIAAAAAMGLTFVGLTAMVSEPIHPGGLTTVLLMAGTLGGAWAIARPRPGLLGAVVGVTGAALALTKINVGAFFLIAAGAWLALARVRDPRRLAWLVALGCVAVPAILMRGLWPAPWVANFALVFAAGAIALVPPLAAAAAGANAGPDRAIRHALLAGMVTSAIIAALVLARGTSPAALIEGVVIAPLAHPGIYFHPAPIAPGSGLLAVGGLATALALARRTPSDRVQTALALLRILAGGITLGLAIVDADREGLTRFAFSYGPALAWLFAWPLLGSESPHGNRIRLWVAWIFVWQVLHAYPVAGSQMAWGTFLWGALLVTGLHEATQVLANRRPLRPATRLVAPATLALALIAVGRLGWTGYHYHVASRDLGLPGAERLRPPEATRQDLRVLVENLRFHGGTVFSLPGQFSLNRWSGRPTPTDANVTHWFSLLSAERQAEIHARLAADPRALVVVHRFLLDYLDAADFRVESTLRDYLETNLVRAFSIGHYDILVHRDRTLAPLSGARIVDHTTGAPQLEIVLRTESPLPIATLVLTATEPAPGATLEALAPSEERPWIATPVSADGTASGEPRRLSAPFTLTGVYRLRIPIPTGSTLVPGRPDRSIVLIDERGVEVATVRYIR